MRSFSRQLLSASALVLVAALASPAFAQTLPSVDAARQGKDLDRQMQAPKLSTPAEIASSPVAQAPAGAEKITFVLNDVHVEGASKISADRIAKTYKHLIGTKISLVQVYDVANAITQIYRDKGYLLSRAVVPKQEIRNGVVKISVVEGFVSNFRIQGETFGARKEIEAYARKLMSTGTLNAGNLERYLLLMNDLPGVSVRSILSPSQTVAGGADMTLVISQKRSQGFASVDNFGNSFIGPWRLSAGIQGNSLFESSDQWNASALIAPDKGELAYVSGGFRHNIGDEGTKAGLNASYTATSPTLPAALGGSLGPEGRAYSITADVNHPFVRSRSFNLVGGAQFDVTQNKTNFDSAFSALNTQDDQRIVRVTGQMNYLDGLAGYNIVNAAVSQGLEIFGSSEKGDAGLSRAQGDPGFTKFNADASRLQSIYGPFTGLLGIAGQYSANSLLASEEFGFGGTEYGRGYDSSEITGDDGLAGKLELAYSGNAEQQYLTDYQLYTFYDVGAVWNRDPGVGIASRQSGASTGVGVRVTFLPNLRGETYVAKPLTSDVQSRGVHGDDLRFRFALTSNF